MTWLDERPDQAAVDRVAAEVIEKGVPERYGVEDPRFAVWLHLVDRRLLRTIGLGHRDLEDWRWADAFYEDGYSPQAAAEEALLDSDLYGSLAEEMFGG